jgi:hypothetical protein
MSAPSEVVELPLHLKWSGPRTFDLADPVQRRRVYEIVLREGGAQDVARYVDPDVVTDLLPDLVLPARVRRAWEVWAEETGRRRRC